MSDAARTALTVFCYCVAALAQLAAIALLVAEGRRTGAALRRWAAADPGPVAVTGPAGTTAVTGPPPPSGATAVTGPRPSPSLPAVDGRSVDGRGADRVALVDPLLGNRFDRTGAVVLLAAGVVVGTIGHLLSL
ncbi:hypothetical protein ACI784_05070 [Geodermatophilus sp. SYSU D01186]